MAPQGKQQRALAALSDAILSRVPVSAQRRVDIDLLTSSSSANSTNTPSHSHGAAADTDDALLVEQRELERHSGSALDWELVSQALRAMHAESQSEFISASAQLAVYDAQVQQQLAVLRGTNSENEGDGGDAKAVDEQVHRIHTDVNDLLREFQDSENHFQAIADLVAPAKRKLEQLEAREKYFEAALEVEKRSQHAKEQAIQATSEALDAFRDLTVFVSTLPLEYTHIRSEAERRIAALTQDLKTFALEKLQNALEAVDWPAELSATDIQAKEAEMSDVGRAFHYLLTLQLSQQSASGKIESPGISIEPPAGGDAEDSELWALQCLFDAILVRFRYHFERVESQTNRLAKPEWCFSHMLTQVREHALFLERVVGSELEKQSAQLPCCDAQVLLLRALIRAAHRKLRKEIASLISQKALFCHTLDEVLLFEQAVDDEFGYSTYTNTNRTLFPRCVDVFTEDMSVFIAWTSVDVEYAKHMLQDVVFEDRKKAWAIADAEDDDLTAAGDLESETSSERMVPKGVLHFTSLLDFMCRRFTFMASEEHRFLYLTQVHHLLLKDMLRECESQARAINVHGASGISSDPQKSVAAVVELCSVINGVQYVLKLLSAWEQSSVFIELTKKVVQSESSRRHVLKIHLEYSKSVLKNAAQAASSAVLAREEAVAVREAISGPGSLIGPTAAFSAAYSVGSKTMRSLLGRSDNVDNDEKAHGNASGGEKRADVDTVPEEHAAVEVDEEELIFSRSIFERQISELRSLLQRLLHSVLDVIMSAFQRDAKAYKRSLFSVTSAPDAGSELYRDVSPEIGTSLAYLARVFAVTKKVLAPECQSQLAKSVGGALDELFFDLVTRSTLSDSYSSHTASTTHTMTLRAREQFEHDMATLTLVLERFVPKSKKFLRMVSDLRNLFVLELSKVRALHTALLDEKDDEISGGAMEQITTMLEVCKIFSMTPEQVLRACEQILSL